VIGGLRYYLDDNNFNDVLHESVITAADQYIKLHRLGHTPIYIHWRKEGGHGGH